MESELFKFDENKSLEIVENNKKIFEDMIVQVEKNVQDKFFEAASRYALFAGNFAILNHPGCFTSQKLEMLLQECGNNLPAVNFTRKLPYKGNKRRVFHVMSEAFYLGGHSRLVRNWIESDEASTHYLIVTWQVRTMPQWLLDAVVKSGGECIPLDAVSNSYLGRAAVLRDITRRYADIVVCHIHMNDPIPVMAFGSSGGPPVIFLNHADHLFWLGSSIADMVLNLRPAAQKLSLSRRNVRANSILPIPLNYPRNSRSKEAVREELGLSRDSVVLLSIAGKEKFSSFSTYDFTMFLRKLLDKHKNVTALLVGPEDKDKFHQAAKACHGRIQAVGVQTDIEKYYNAADIYLDSYMFSSLTAALDAGLRGLPVVSLKNCHNETLSLNDSAFEGLNVQFYGLEDYLCHIGRLITDREFRKSEGMLLEERIRSHHADSWKTQLENCYALVENTQHSLYLHMSENQVGMEDLILALYLEQNKI